MGGYKEDIGSDIITTSDGGYITAGCSNSANVDVINVHGGRDAWIVKFTALNEIEWRFKYGGSYDDSARESCGKFQPADILSLDLRFQTTVKLQ
ncbi:MAG: hypothetical protein IPP73_03600 [Chitinophagaceae bacterium]|nr:hypothetical protein [Chitinophagaceae bacterium]